jgi:predicted Zn-dependent protease
MNGRDKVNELCQRVLDRCGDYEAEVLYFVEDNALTRFANNSIHQNVAERDTKVYVRLYHGAQMGMASSNQTDDGALDEIVARARAFIDVSPEDPDFPGLAEPAEYIEVKAFDSHTAEFSPQSRANAVGVVCNMASTKGLNAFGALFIAMDEVGIANTKGLFTYHTGTRVDFQTVVLKNDASGFAQGSSWRIEEIPIEDLGRGAIEKAEKGVNPQVLDPGEYTVVLDPYATQDIVMLLNQYGMSAQAVQEGRSWMNDRIGKKVMSEEVTIWDDGLDLNGIPMPFDFEGVPKQRTEIIREGVVVGPIHNRRTAKKEGVTSTGHALPPTFPLYLREGGPRATNVFMRPGTVSIEDMIRSTKHGLYITRFWYTRQVHPRDCIVTGMTRDGVFMIEDGEITFPAKNLRFTQSYVEVLANVEAVGDESNLLCRYHGNLPSRTPALKIQTFNFTGSTV